ncbi:hypothetical protein EU245_08255 [Lentibacillus lipolyticus]|nr:hypothetical protein EU245_08255 [Lentibacillus lipolyticus]
MTSHDGISKKQEMMEDILLLIAGIALCVILKISYPIHFVANVFIAITGLFFVAIGIIRLVIDNKIVEKQRQKAVWWQLNLPVVLGIILINLDVFYAAIHPSGQYPSDMYRIIFVSLGIALWIFAFSYDTWRKYRNYLKNK